MVSPNLWHRHVVEIGLTLLHQASSPLSYWSYAFQIAVYLINRMPIPILNNVSPYTKLFHQQPNYSHLRTFGCLCFPWPQPYNSNKLLPRSCSCFFLSYSFNAYKCLDLSSNKLFISRHVQFGEATFPLTTAPMSLLLLSLIGLLVLFLLLTFPSKPPPCHHHWLPLFPYFFHVKDLSTG